MSRDLPDGIEYSVQRLAVAVEAVADELHTANLMQHLQFMVTGLEGPPMTPGDAAECEKVGDRIRDRLGLPPKTASA